MKKRRANPEQRLHKAVAQYLGRALKPPTIWTTIGHGGGGKVRGALLKAMGVQPGWPDVIVVGPTLEMRSCRLAVIGFELKSPTGRQSPEQRQIQMCFEASGAMYHVCRSVDEVEGFLRGVGIPLHATVGAKVAA